MEGGMGDVRVCAALDEREKLGAKAPLTPVSTISKPNTTNAQPPLADIAIAKKTRGETCVG